MPPPDFSAPEGRRVVEEPKRTDTSLLLDIKEEIGGLRSDVGHVALEQLDARASRAGIHQKLDSMNAKVAELDTKVDRIEPIVDRLDRIDIHRLAARAIVRKVFRSGWTVTVASAAALAWLAHEWDTVRGWLAKVLR